MRTFSRCICFIVALASFSFAQIAPKPTPAPELMKDSSGAIWKMDFSTPLAGISDPGMLFSHFSAKPLLIFYFSPKCPHCQDHFPSIQALIKEYEHQGLTGIGIALGGGIKKNDVRIFIDQFNATIPIFQDVNTKFGPTYGTGYVPVVFVVKEDGSFYRFPDLSKSNMESLRATLDTLLKKK
ncbi:MAG: redoxin domain-containing protein [Fibrobacteraceae bacterium]